MRIATKRRHGGKNRRADNRPICAAGSHKARGWVGANWHQFAALTGRRRAEFLKLRRDALTDDGIVFSFAKIKAGASKRHGLIGWTPALRGVISDAGNIKRPGKAMPASLYVFPNRSGQAYTESGFKAMWSKIMVKWCPRIQAARDSLSMIYGRTM